MSVVDVMPCRIDTRSGRLLVAVRHVSQPAACVSRDDLLATRHASQVGA